MSPVESVVQALLYEGYMLYPYRPSSVKNRQRWTFGGVYPEESVMSNLQFSGRGRRGSDYLARIRSIA